MILCLLLAREARADFEVIDVRSPVRVGFAYTGITRAPEASLSWGASFDVLHVTRRLTFQIVLDAESNSRPDLSDKDPLSQFGGFGLGAGLFYLTEGEVGLGFESTAWLTFDANELVGGGFATRAYVYPFYMRIEDAIHHRSGRLTAWVKSSIAVWAGARVDWTGGGRGGTLMFGASLDLVRIFMLPYIELLTKKLR